MDKMDLFKLVDDQTNIMKLYSFVKSKELEAKNRSITTPNVPRHKEREAAFWEIAEKFKELLNIDDSKVMIFEDTFSGHYRIISNEDSKLELEVQQKVFGGPPLIYYSKRGTKFSAPSKQIQELAKEHGGTLTPFND